jgi:hypothetical protein
MAVNTQNITSAKPIMPMDLGRTVLRKGRVCVLNVIQKRESDQSDQTGTV